MKGPTLKETLPKKVMLQIAGDLRENTRYTSQMALHGKLMYPAMDDNKPYAGGNAY